jgi:hypothetical protein
MSLTLRHDPQPLLYSHYADALSNLRHEAPGAVTAVPLREAAAGCWIWPSDG